MEEYITAKHAWSLTMTDLSEIARNSVLISSARHELREELIGGPDPCDRCNVPKRRFDFRHDERARNNMIIGLPPPMYPVHGLERSDPSDKKLDTDEDNQAFGKKRALQRLSPDDKRAEIEREVRREVAWRKGDKAPAKKRGLSASFFSSKTLRMHVLTTAPSSPHRFVGELLLLEDTPHACAHHGAILSPQVCWQASSLRRHCASRRLLSVSSEAPRALHRSQIERD
jgi:hypothetical protein